jgi:hypothetical protein
MPSGFADTLFEGLGRAGLRLAYGSPVDGRVESVLFETQRLFLCHPGSARMGLGQDDGHEHGLRVSALRI